MTEEDYKKYKEALLLFYGGGRFILNNRFLPGIPTLPDIQEYTITFTNLDYPDLPIDIPEPITDISGTVVTLPTMSGEYEDTYNYYTPDSWSIGSFGEEIELSDNLIANLVFNVVPKVITYTLSFVNIEYPDFDVSLPDSIIGPEGTEITLPEVEGEFIEDDYIYTPSSWSIGSFGSSYILNENTQAELLWNVVPVQQENVIGGLISETESIDWKSISVLGNMEVDNVNLYSELTQFGTLSVDNIALTQDFYMLGKLMHDYDPAIEDATFVVYDTLSDNIVSFFNQELTLSEVQGIVLDSPELIIGVPQTVPNRSFFFTENGREETNNTVLLDTEIIPLYDESGNLITDEETITLYDNSQALSFMKEDGNMEQALNSDLLVDNDGELSLQLSSQTRSRSVEQEETITIESTFGAAVTIPEGYTVDSVMCSRGYVFASSVTGSTTVQYELPGEKVYFDDTNTSLIGVSVRPALQISVIYNASGTVRSTLSCTYNYSGKAPTSASADYVNSGGYFVKGKAVFGQTGDTTGAHVVSDMQAYPVYFNLSDSSGNWLYFCFKVPSSLWEDQNGQFSWLGNVSDTSDLAYWYNTRPVKINLSLKQVSREITAWSVQTERVFVLQFSNSEHPSLDIPMPSNETGHSGTVITLPTVTGEYTEEGLVYTPVAWNIGAFGDSYTLNNDVTAILQLSSRVALPTVYSYSGTQTESSVAPDASIDTGLTYDSGNLYLGETNDGQGNATRYGWEAEEAEPVPSYTEITLYPGSTLYSQYGITNTFIGDVNSTYVYDLYLDQEKTTLWNGFNYSNEYEIGYYSSQTGEWTTRISSIADMPSTTVQSGYKFGFVLLDNSKLWIMSNSTEAVGTGVSKIIVRIHKKDQQYYAAYFNTSDALANISLSSTTAYLYFTTENSSAHIYGKYIKDNGALVGVVGSAGNSVKVSGDKFSTRYVGSSNYLQLTIGSVSTTRNARSVIFTLPHKTFIGWLASDKSNNSVSTGGLRKLWDETGNEISYDGNKKYTLVAIYATTSGYYNDSLYDGLYGIGCDDTNPGVLCFKQTYESLSANRLWIAIEDVDNYVWAYFTSSGSSATTNTGITSGNSYLLFDNSGTPILYSASKSYDTLEVQYHTSNGYLMRGTIKFDTFTDNGSGQLQCTARFTETQVGVNRIKVWIKDIS